MLEYHVDAFLARELAHRMLEPVGPIIDDVVGAELFCLGGLGVVADRGDHRAADRLRYFDGRGADSRAAGMNQDGLARPKLGIVEQHVLDRRKRDRCASGIAKRDAFRYPDHEPDGEVEEVASKAVDMNTENALDVFAKVVPALAAGPAFSAGERAIHDDAVPDTKTGYAGSHCRDLARGFRADHQRQLAFGERHAAPAPHVDVIERHRADPNLHFAGGRRRRRGRLPQLELAVGNEGQRSHRSRLAGKSETVGRSAPNACRRMDGPVNERCSKRLRISVETEPSRRFAPITSDTFWPPNPKEFDS